MVYPEELKTDIVAQHKNGVSVKQLSTEYGICVRTIYRWANTMAAIKLQKYQMTHSNTARKSTIIMYGASPSWKTSSRF